MTKKAIAVKIQTLTPGLKKMIAGVLASESIRKGSVSVIPASDKVLRRLNQKFLKKNRTTDVLAFSYGFVATRGSIAGDVFVSVDVARRTSKQLGIAFQEELARYCIHGILHLVGYDDRTPSKKRKMWVRQEEYIKKYFGKS